MEQNTPEQTEYSTSPQGVAEKKVKDALNGLDAKDAKAILKDTLDEIDSYSTVAFS